MSERLNLAQTPSLASIQATGGAGGRADPFSRTALEIPSLRKSDAFVALPGGIGTLEELVEQLTWAQLGRHAKPILLVNIDGFWAPFLTLLEHMREEAFIRADMNVRFITVDKIADALPAIHAAALPPKEAAGTPLTEKL